jgi:hypothetical protein
MADIVPFRASKTKPTPEDLAMRESQSRANRAELARQLRNELRPGSKRGPIMRREDQIAVAQALYGLLKRVEEHPGIPKRAVLIEAGIGNEKEDPTKHLSEYAIPPNLRPEERAKKRLCKNAKPYERIAKAAAKLAALDEDEVLLEVFGQADFWTRGGARKPASEFEELAFRLRFVAEGVAAKHNLTAFFRDVERARVVAAPSRECERRELDGGRLLEPGEIEIEFFRWPFGFQWPWPIEFNQPSWEAEVEEQAAFPPYPSLVLGTWPLSNAFPVSVVAEMRSTDGNARQVSGTTQGQYVVHLRLCIAPIGKQLRATLVLRVRLGATLSPLQLPTWAAQGDEAPMLIFPTFDPGSNADAFWLLRPGQSKIVGHNAATNEEAACEVRIERDPIPSPFKGYFKDLDRLTSDDESSDGSQSSDPALQFLPITGAICEDWFKFLLNENQYNVMERSIAERALGMTFSGVPRGYGPFDRSTLAAALDDFVCEPLEGLDLSLEELALRLKAALEKARCSALEDRAAGWERVRERWIAFSGADE